MLDPVIKPFAGTVLNAVITWYGIPPNELELATLTVVSICIWFDTTEQVNGTVTVASPACGTGKYAERLVVKPVNKPLVPSYIAHQTIGTNVYSQVVSAGGCGPVDALFSIVNVAVLEAIEQLFVSVGVNVIVTDSSALNVLLSLVFIVKFATLLFTVTVPVNAVVMLDVSPVIA